MTGLEEEYRKGRRQQKAAGNSGAPTDDGQTAKAARALATALQKIGLP